MSMNIKINKDNTINKLILFDLLEHVLKIFPMKYFSSTHELLIRI